MDSCTLIVSLDSKKCSKACSPEEFLSDKVDTKNYKKCLKDCTGKNYSYTLKSVKYCTAACPDDMFIKGN